MAVLRDLWDLKFCLSQKDEGLFGEDERARFSCFELKKYQQDILTFKLFN